MSSSFVLEVVPQIRRILESSDLSTISAKGVRKQLIASGRDEGLVKEHRAAIDDHIAEIYAELASDGERSASSEDDGPIASSSQVPQSSLPEPLKRDVKRERGSGVKEEKPDRASGETDAEMAARLQREFDTFTANRASRSGGAVRTKRKNKVKKKSAEVGSDGEVKPKKRRAVDPNSGFNKPLLLSDSLAEFVGEPRLSRPQTVKRIWDYVKEHELQDPSDKRWIRCDGTLQRVFHVERLHMFTMNKLLVPHFRNPDEIIVKGEGGPIKSEPIAKDEVESEEDY